MKKRCLWAGTDPLYVQYHDEEWGVPVRDDQRLFEMIVLDGAQAGLSWITILRKRENYREAFDQFDVDKVASYGSAKIKRLLANPGIVRNRLKIQSAVDNAKAVLKVIEEFGSLHKYLWQFAEWPPRQNQWKSIKQVPARTAESDVMSRELKKRGFRFVGSTICYAFMQAAGMVNDHTMDCFRHREVKRLAKR